MTAKAKIAYFGSDPICLPGLRYLLCHASEFCELALVVAQPDRPSGRGKRLQQNPVAAFASEHGLKLLQPEKPDAQLAELLLQEGISLAFVMAYGHFLPRVIREATPGGMLNFHGSILPAYRGASPIETAIAMGESETGVCLMRVVQEMDAGAVADCERVPIEETDTAVVVRAKVGAAVVPLLRRRIKAILKGELDFTEQDAAQATFSRKIQREDAALDFFQSAQRLDCRLRAFWPWPGGYFDHGQTRIKVGRAVALSTRVLDLPGTVLTAADTLDVATMDGVFRVYELQRPGGRMLPVKEFLKGYRIEPGERLPSVTGRDLVRINSI